MAARRGGGRGNPTKPRGGQTKAQKPPQGGKGEAAHRRARPQPTQAARAKARTTHHTHHPTHHPTPKHTAATTRPRGGGERGQAQAAQPPLEKLPQLPAHDSSKSPPPSSVDAFAAYLWWKALVAQAQLLEETSCDPDHDGTDEEPDTVYAAEPEIFMPH